MVEAMVMQDIGQPILHLRFDYPIETEQGIETHREGLELPLFTAWNIAEAVQKLGVEQALVFASFAVMIAKMDPHIADPFLTPAEQLKLSFTIKELANMFGGNWVDLEDRVLNFTYQMLRRKAMTRELAATFASIKLSRHYETEPYRKKLDRWVDTHNLPKIGQTKRRPRKQVK